MPFLAAALPYDEFELQELRTLAFVDGSSTTQGKHVAFFAVRSTYPETRMDLDLL